MPSTYGMDFGGAFIIPENPQDSITFERVRYYSDSPKQILPIKSSFRVHEKGLKPAMREPYSIQTYKFDIEGDPDMAVNRIKKYINTHDTRYSSSYDVYDPIRAQMLITFESDGKNIVASKSGNGCILSFTFIDNKWKGWNVGKKRNQIFQDRISNGLKFSVEEARDEEFEIDNDDDTLRLPDLVPSDAIDIGEEILGLSYIKVDERTTLISIRTRPIVIVVKVKVSGDKLKLKKIFELKSDQYWSMFSHSNFHKSVNDDISYIVIDVNAQFRLFNYEDESFEEIELPFESFYEPSDLSSFKSSSWINDDRLILYSRMQIHELNFDTMEMKCRVTGGIFSVFLDLKPIPNKLGWFVLFTTKELILVNCTKGFKKILAWKHSLNVNDKSLYLQVLQMPYSEKNIMCLISSKETNFNQLVQINPHDLKVIDYPNWFFTNNKPIGSSIITPIGGNFTNIFLLLQLTDLNELSSCVLKLTSFYKNQEKYGKPLIEKVVKPEYFKYGQLKNELFFYMISDDMKPVYSKLIGDVFDTSISEDKVETQKAVQLYADDISSKLAKFVDGLKSTINFQQLVEYFNNHINIDELMDMITEFIDHFQTSNVFDFNINKNLWKADMLMTFNTPISDIDAMKNVYKEFLPLLKGNENRMEIAKYIGFHLILSTLVIQKRTIDKHHEDVDKFMAANMKLLNESQLALIKEFENDMDVPAQFSEFDTGEDEKVDKKKPIIDMPIITVSQSHKKRKSSTPLELSQSQVYNTNTSSQVYNTTQSQSTPSLNASGSQKKSGSKKKKRRTGF